jgi:uncharacterized RDD family membrane protein YckC
MGTATGIVIPEAVVLAFETAGIGSRMVAEVIDLLLQGAAVVAVIVGAGALGHTVIGDAGVYFGLFAAVFVYPIAIETLWRGRSVGKAAMGLRVVTVEGGPIRFRHALIRGAFTLIDFWFTSGAAAILSVLVTRRNQRIGDLVAGTLVLRERTGAPAPSAATFAVPPGWEPYAGTLDVSGLTATDYQATRSFLLRAPTLDALTRDRLARQIAEAILPRLRHTPPPGIPAEAFLVCVAAMFQRRQRGRAPGVGPPAAAPPREGPWAPSGVASHPAAGPAPGGFAPPE